ncbi:uncharacterized protein [Misgurnus anguillicaudatus]|uniref:uncharacterized protein n=1 Tax=Misgurnus anguillicaudatus TaxID=75329 RepID=UPI003CCFC580
MPRLKTIVIRITRPYKFKSPPPPHPHFTTLGTLSNSLWWNGNGILALYCACANLTATVRRSTVTVYYGRTADLPESLQREKLDMSVVSNTTSGSIEIRVDVKRTIVPMEWKEQHDVLLCREILLTEPYRYKKGSVDKGKAWSTIADTLNCSQDHKFRVTQRSVRERFSLIQTKYKTKNNKDEKSSGTSAEITELDELIEEITEKERAAEENKTSDESTRKLEMDRAKAEEARKKAMERVSQTNRRLSEEGEDWTNNKRRRRSGNDTIEFLRERSQAERVLREKELELKKIQVEEQAKAAQQTQKQISDMMQLMQQQQQQMQAMQTMLLQQQQQQGQALLGLIENLSNK